MISINYGPDLSEINRDNVPDPEDDYFTDDLGTVFDRLLDDEGGPDMWISGELDFS